jgi:hypothetical protein
MGIRFAKAQPEDLFFPLITSDHKLNPCVIVAQDTHMLITLRNQLQLLRHIGWNTVEALLRSGNPHENISEFLNDLENHIDDAKSMSLEQMQNCLGKLRDSISTEKMTSFRNLAELVQLMRIRSKMTALQNNLKQSLNYVELVRSVNRLLTAHRTTDVSEIVRELLMALQTNDQPKICELQNVLVLASKHNN